MKNVLLLFLKTLVVGPVGHSGPKNDASSQLQILSKDSGSILEFKGSIRHVQKGHPALVTQVDLIFHTR